jgi:hypothetical protein
VGPGRRRAEEGRHARRRAPRVACWDGLAAALVAVVDEGIWGAEGLGFSAAESSVDEAKRSTGRGFSGGSETEAGFALENRGMGRKGTHRMTGPSCIRPSSEN